ncbi:MAG: single-stranded DNA-binding protein [Pseudonocardia sp.]|nr:single-stranded DNA-binding protein [Pseudonocardia sp.]
MANEPTITVCGNTTADAELRFTPSGAAVANWTLACTPRVKDGDGWKDGETTFYRCAAWRQLGESAAETITKGMRLLVHGRFRTRSFETSDGEKRLSLEIDVEHVGPDLRYATAKVSKVSRSSGDSGFSPPVGGGQAPAGDPWGSAPPASGGATNDDEAPL